MSLLLLEWINCTHSGCFFRSVRDVVLMTYTRTITISFTVEVVGEVITDIKELIQQVQTEGRQELYSQFW